MTDYYVIDTGTRALAHGSPPLPGLLADLGSRATGRAVELVATMLRTMIS